MEKRESESRDLPLLASLTHRSQSHSHRIACSPLPPARPVPSARVRVDPASRPCLVQSARLRSRASDSSCTAREGRPTSSRAKVAPQEERRATRSDPAGTASSRRRLDCQLVLLLHHLPTRSRLTTTRTTTTHPRSTRHDSPLKLARTRRGGPLHLTRSNGRLRNIQPRRRANPKVPLRLQRHKLEPLGTARPTRPRTVSVEEARRPRDGRLPPHQLLRVNRGPQRRRRLSILRPKPSVSRPLLSPASIPCAHCLPPPFLALS